MTIVRTVDGLYQVYLPHAVRFIVGCDESRGRFSLWRCRNTAFANPLSINVWSAPALRALLNVPVWCMNTAMVISSLWYSLRALQFVAPSYL